MGAAQLADLEHLGAVVGLGVVGRERHRAGDVGHQLLPAAGAAGAVGADEDGVAVGAGLAGQQGRERPGGGAGVEVAVLLGDDDVEPVELRQLHGDVIVGDGAHPRAAVVVVEDLLVGPALEGVAEGAELAHPSAMAEAVADEVDGRAGEGAGRRRVGHHEGGQGDDRRGEGRRQAATSSVHGPSTRSTAAFGGRCDVSAPRKVASPNGAMPPLASAM